MSKFDFTIIGNGVIGLSIAYSLSNLDNNLKINIIGRESHEGSASIAAGAMINCFAEITNKTFKTSYGEKKFAMAHTALKMWNPWLEELNDNISKQENKIKLLPGTYVMLNNESGVLDSDNYHAMKQALNKYNEPYEEILDLHKIPGINPIPNHRPLCAMYLPNEGLIDSNFYIKQLKNILSSRTNITFTNDVAIKINHKSNSISSISLSSGELIESSQFILANGAYAQSLINQITELKETTPQILAGVGYAVLLKQLKDNLINNVIRTPNRAGACGLHALPREDNLYIGATNNVYMLPEEKLKAGLINFLLYCAIEQLNQNFYNSTIEGYHIGNRPVSIDGFPLIGKTCMNNLWMINGTYRDGFHQSPLIASHIANSLIGKDGLIDQTFTSSRKPIKTMTRQQAIEEFVYHYTAGTFEHGTKLPKFMPISEYEKMITIKITNLYDQLDSDYGLNPEILLMIDLAENRDELIAFFKNYLKKNS